MVEHTRPHPRLVKSASPLPGKRVKLEAWIPEVAAVQLKIAVITIDTGSGSGVYARQFTDHALFGQVLRDAAAQGGVTFSSVTLTGWSAGHGAIREILSVPEYYAQVSRVLLVDGLHTGYDGGKAGPLESKLEPDHPEIFLQFARDAGAGKKAMLVTHSEIFPGTFASTTETAEWMIGQLELKRRPVLRHGPMGTQQLSEVKRGGFRLIGYAGNSAPDPVDQLHSLAEYLRWLSNRAFLSR